MVLTAVVTDFVDFASDTVVLLISGCVSLIAVTGVLAGTTFIFYKHLKYFWFNNSSAGESIPVHSTADESLLCTQNPVKLPSQSTECNNDLSSSELSDWFLSRDDSGKTKNLSSLQDYLKITVASTIPGSTYNKHGEVREFLEHIVRTLLSENLDDVPLTPLSEDEQYTKFFSKYHSKLASILITLSESLHSTKDSESLDDAVKPSVLYNQLRTVIKEVQEEAALLPSFQDYNYAFGPASIETRLEGQSYEEILSTAALNKIVSKSQKSNRSFNSEKDVKADVSNETEHRNYISNSWSFSPKEQLSLTVEEHVEEITSNYQLYEADSDSIIECSNTSYNVIERHRAPFPELGKDVVDVGYNSYDEDSVTELVSNIDSWEENWLFQKKKKNKVKNTVSQVSVPMLVPNPSEKYRALIGDVDVDETSDLSECSDSIIEELIDDILSTENSSSATKTNYIYKYDFKSSLETPTFKNDLNESESFSLDHDQDSSGVTSISRDLSDAYSFSSLSPCRSDEESVPWNDVREAKNENILLSQVDSGEGSLETQSENECLQNGNETHLPFAKESATCENLNLNGTTTALLENGIKSSPSQENLATPPKPGTIAEREHKKWEHASPIPNNPYSKENIEKRNLHNLLPRSCVNSISKDHTEYEETEYKIDNEETRNDIKKYERDYYVNADKKTRSEERNGIEIIKSTSQENGFLKPSSSSDESTEKPKPNLVRVLSWSDRRKPDIEIRKRLPSVKELAKQFSAQTNPIEIRKITAVKNQTVHSLTARSMSKEFRDGLKNNIGTTFNRNIHVNGSSVSDKLEEYSLDDTSNIPTTDNAIIF